MVVRWLPTLLVGTLGAVVVAHDGGSNIYTRAPSDLCTAHNGTDYVCCDISNTPGVAGPGACCALCEATPGCTAWKFDVADPKKICYLKAGALSHPTACPTCVVGYAAPPPPPPPPAPRTPVFSCPAPPLPAGAALVVYNDSSYEASVTGSGGGAGPWLDGGDVIVHLAGAYYSVAAGTLATMALGPPASGADGFGAFTAFPMALAAVGGPAAGARIAALFACYASGLVAFNLTTDGAVTGPSPGGLLTHFPSFVSRGAVGEELGWLLNGGIWTLFEFWGVGTNHGYNGGDGPAWFINTSFAPSVLAPPGAPTKPATAIVCALSHFKSSLVGVFDDPSFAQRRLSWGLAGSATAAPPGFTTSVGLYAGSGVSETTYAWGELLTAAYGTRRLPLSADVLNRQLSYWSDNGAVYFQSYWDDVCKRNCTAQGPGHDAESLFTALKAHHVANRLPYGIYQLDTWWFLQQADVVPGGGDLDCVDWTPRADLWPNGLAPITRRDVPLLLYAWGWVPVGKGQRMTNWTWVPSPDGSEAIVALNETRAFYTMIRDRFMAYNGTSFEQDNMGSIGGWAQVAGDPEGGERWWAGFASPWCDAGIPVQICEATASDLLESVRYPCVTSTRDQIDDVPGDHQSHGPNEDLFLIRWRVGFDRLLIGALKLKPFFDNVWSTRNMPGPPWGDANESYPELAVVLSVLGGGAVGIGDAIGYSNRSLIMACAMEDGTLLSPSRPSHYIDAMYLPPRAQPFPVAVGRVLQAPTFIGGATWTTVLAIDVPSPFGLLPAHLAPDLTDPQPGVVTGHLAVRWSPGFAAVDAACADGAPIGGCAARFAVDAPLELMTGVPPVNYTHFHEVVTIAPVFASGFALLGELPAKVVRVSEARFPSVTPSAGGLSFVVRGAAAESVSVAVATPDQRVQRVPLAFGPGGGAVTVSCTAGATPPCAVA